MVVEGYGLCGLYGLWLLACADLAKGCAVSRFFMGTSSCYEIPCAAQLRKSTVNCLMAFRSVVGAASEIASGAQPNRLRARMGASEAAMTGNECRFTRQHSARQDASSEGRTGA